MKLWLFTCTDKTRPIVSARIAAPDRDGALYIAAGRWPGASGILAYFGEDVTITSPGIISAQAVSA